jgi:uncharacterized protein (TIGR02118 family)
MVRVVGAYIGTPADRFDLAYYRRSHVAIAHDLLDAYGLQSVRVSSDFEPPAGGGQGLLVVSEMVFASREGFEAGLKAQGEKLFEDLRNFTDLQPMLQVCGRTEQE